jgi:chromosomal replication initiator protein
LRHAIIVTERLRAEGGPLITSQHDVAAALEQAIVQRIGKKRFNLWFASNARFRWTDDELTVGVPNLFFQNYLDTKFGSEVAAAAAETIGQAVPVRFAIEPALFQAARREQEAARTPTPTPGRTERESPNKPARRWRRLSEFVVGACNRVGHAAATSVAEAPGEGPNPLVLHGAVGTGKTHLLEGIYAGIRKTHPDWEVRFVTAEEFTNAFLHAMHAGKLGAFRRRFRECDALLVDDLQFLAPKRATAEEFLHTFDALQSENRQLVVTCDCHPRLADEFTPEMADRLLGGAAWGLAPPDAETRLAILRARVLRLGEPAAPDDVLQHLAGRLRGNVRELEGALHALRHFSRVTGKPIDLALANEALADLLRHAVRVVLLTDIDAGLSRVLKLGTGALQAKQRAWAVSHPRMLAMYLARKHTAASYSEIGQHFGGRNHSTAVAAEKKVRLWLRDDGVLCLGERTLKVREVVELVERELMR